VGGVAGNNFWEISGEGGKRGVEDFIIGKRNGEKREEREERGERGRSGESYFYHIYQALQPKEEQYAVGVVAFICLSAYCQYKIYR
jgi:hypothetical protein